ncbi:MAG: bifunctional folylpolyglutamate synthase/dihydrofolate synthase [Bacteroidetes bacterium]|uniref:Dihydrofolate synthase/folylpolyglutamate synthase n=1 Tax=Candidatus Enterocola intestinipullorum TaxID=2840783 RepID=A0A9D9EII8_9BACT|nr:bifunctional folylpolyglutamate synthase/dihydrofolate synthase [Candidatus Enterocola intestinipullorum]
MNYGETLEYLYAKTPMYQKKGDVAYKEGLDNILRLDGIFGHPHHAYKTIHIAGTNGKGSVSHTLAAILQSAGYKTGLYTSPHLKDFSERIRVNGKPVDKHFVSRFVEKAKPYIEEIKPSFFEITTIMAFEWFRRQKVDVAVIETGLGGRLDSTNIIRPVLSIITNVSMDHVKLLGNTIEKIAAEKAGIIKEGIPVVVGEADETTRPIYEAKSPNIIFAEDFEYPDVDYELKGYCQAKNKRTIQAALEVLRLEFDLNREAVENGFAHVVELTGLQGRWQKLGDNPAIIADTGHNEGAIKYISEQLIDYDCDTLRIVFGMVNDKDVSTVLSLMPKHAVYYFTAAGIERALPAEDLKNIAQAYGLSGKSYATVKEAYTAAKKDASAQDLIFVGGSNFVVAEIL